MPIRAITFDFWRTLFRDAEGIERREYRVEALTRATGVPADTAREALRIAMREFLRVHVEEQRTLRPEDAIPMLERDLNMTLTHVAEELIDAFANSILKFSPLPIEDAFEAVRAARKHVPVGVISDTGISPGQSLLGLLDKHDMRPHFNHFTFSDIVGVSKPQAAMYHHAAQGLNVPVREILHIGDLEPTDIAGALNVGAKAALFAGDNDKYIANSRAHYTFTTWRQFINALPQILTAE